MRIKYLFLTILIIIFTLFPLNSVFASTQDFYFEDFTADYYLTKDEEGVGKLHVKEVLTAVFPETDQNHGITRTIPFLNQGGENRTIKSTDDLNLTVLRNGETEPINRINEENNAYVVYIGRASEYVHGKQVYTLEYDFYNVITEFDQNGENISGKNMAAAFQELYWDTNGTGWNQRFEKLTANLHVTNDILEKMDEKTWCYVGAYGENIEGKCETKEIEDGFSFRTKDLAVGENLTFVTEFKPDTFKVILEKNYSLVIALIIEIILIIVFVSLKYSNWRKKAKAQYDLAKSLFIAPQYQSPNDESVCVAEGEQIYLKKTKSSYVATLLELAVSKKVTIKKAEQEEGKKKPKYDWSVILNVEPDELTGSQKQMMNILSGNGGLAKGDEIPIKKHTATQYLANCATNYTKKAVETLEEKGYFLENAGEKSGSGKMSIVIFVMFIVAIINGRALIKMAGSLFGRLFSTMGNLLIGKEFIPQIMIVLAVITIIVLWIIGKKTRKYEKYTNEGIKLAKYLEGMELYINMAETDRLKFLQSVEGADTSNAGIVKLYEKLLPWASLFGAEESWVKELAKYYELEDVSDDLGPDVLNGIITSNMLNNINNVVRTSTAYTPPSSGGVSGGGSSGSSGGGGGGFSGGGGGGGGGGGW